MKKMVVIILVVAVLLVGAVYWSKFIQSKDPNIISRTGIHWHPILDIYVKDEKQGFPPNIGVGTQYISTPTYDHSMKMTAVHTHDDADKGIIHLEFGGIVRKEDTRLVNFFKIWDKDFNSFGPNVKMAVNGETTSALGEYEMKDGDKIELRYE